MSATKLPKYKKGNNARGHYTLFTSINPLSLSAKSLADKLYL
jgi:hypothetical protein